VTPHVRLVTIVAQALLAALGHLGRCQALERAWRRWCGHGRGNWRGRSSPGRVDMSWGRR
jgi:hypothetical protein